MKILPTLLVATIPECNGFFGPILPGLESFGKLSQLSDELSGADLLEHLMREEQSNNADYIIDEIEASLLRDENSAFRIGGNSLRMSEVANGSSCSIDQLEKKNSMAKLVCPNKNGDSVLDGTPCEWECNSGLSYGNKLRNQVKCSGGNWDGVKKVKCNAKCKWTELRAMQTNNEFSQCKSEANFGEARFKCKLPKDKRSGNKGARCSCKNSRRNSGKCSWQLF